MTVHLLFIIFLNIIINKLYMSQTSDNNERIAKNTLHLYVRMLFMMVASLYTSSVIQNALGVEDFGICIML